jgi:DNA-binding transcriptional ArsR family regulator
VLVLRDEIKMDRRTFESLASETRIAILKLLDKRQMTVTEISKQLDLAKSTVHEHLAKMLESELVDKIEDHRKWTYYRLTYKAKRILRPNEMIKIMVLLGTSLLAFIGGILEIAGYRHALPQQEQMLAYPKVGGGALAPEMAEKASPLMAEPGHASLLLGVSLTAAALLLGYWSWRRWKAFRS